MSQEGDNEKPVIAARERGKKDRHLYRYSYDGSKRSRY